MPTYEFLNNDTGESEEHFMSYKDLDEYKENNPHLTQQVSAPNIVGGHGDRVKTDAGFKEVLAKIGENHKGSHLHKASGKDIKTREIVKKHAAIQAREKK